MTLPDYCAVPVGLKRGDKGDGVRRIQEWLSLAGHPVVIDGDFGPATERALFDWRVVQGLQTAGPVGSFDARYLAMPMTNALAGPGHFVDSPLDIARGYADELAREIGGNNMGPWVRLFSGGTQGKAVKWCGYFGRHVARQAGHPWAERISPNCDVIAKNAHEDARMRPSGERPVSGDLFLCYKVVGQRRDYYHVGVVDEVAAEAFSTVEGNSNDDGSADGHEVARRWRGFGGKAFVRMGR
jgi:hypothetical protein